MSELARAVPPAVRRDLMAAAPPSQLADALRSIARAIDARKAGDHEEAYRAALRAKHAAQRSATVRELLGLSAFALERWHEARAELMTYRRLTDRHNHDAAIADCYTHEGDPDRAIEVLADLDPSEIPVRSLPDVLLARARAFAAKGKPDLALGILRSARVADPAARARLEQAIADLTA